MTIACRVFCLIIKFSLINFNEAQGVPVEENTITNNEPPESPTAGFLSDVEIMKIYMTSRNSLKIFWGITPEDIRLNRTYGVFYDIDTKEKFTEPKTRTQDPCIEILDLEYCKRYFFAVAPLDNGLGINPNSTNIRSILTYMDPLAPPLDLHADFLPGINPFLQIKWTASCRNIPDPLSYKIRLIENFPLAPPFTNTLKTPLSNDFQRACTVPVHLGGIAEISVANELPRALFSEPIKLKIPHQMQPFDVRLAVNESNQAFLLYWREPYVPFCDGQYFYEVFVYEDRNVTTRSNYTVFRVNRPGFVYRGNRSEYTFGVDLMCCDYSRRSEMSDLVYGNIGGEIEHIIQF